LNGYRIRSGLGQNSGSGADWGRIADPGGFSFLFFLLKTSLIQDKKKVNPLRTNSAQKSARIMIIRPISAADSNKDKSAQLKNQLECQTKTLRLYEGFLQKGL